MMLLIQDLCKTYENYGKSGRLEVLDHIDMKVETEEFVSIIGPSGCGKSTIFNLLCEVETKSGGTVTIDGSPAKAGAFSYMQQRDLLMDWKRIWENIALPLKLRGVNKKEAKERVRSQSELYGLAGFENAWPSELSGGDASARGIFQNHADGRKHYAPG